MRYGVVFYLDPMSSAAPLINPLLASVVGLVVITAVVLVIVVAVAKYCIRRRRSKVTRFGNYTRMSTSTCFFLSLSAIRLVIIPTTFATVTQM